MSITRRGFCRTSLAAAALAAGGARAARRPNVLLVTADDLGPQLGCYGDRFARTPHLDAFSAGAVHFRHGYVTQASCSPSRSSMFTGKYPHQNGQYGLSHRGYSMHPGQATLPKLLGGAGYRTGVIGKIHVEPVADLPFDFQNTRSGPTRKVREVATQAEGFIRDTGERPWFLMVNYFDPHRPLEKQVDGLPERPLEPGEVDCFGFLGLDAPPVRQDVANYYNCVSRVDTGMGLLLDALRASGQEDDTLVIFIGDHGPPFTRSKTTCYEAGLRIPYLVRFPGRQRTGLPSDALVSTVDLLPTILAAADLPAPDDLAGRSLLPLLSGREAPWRETLCAEYHAHHQAGWFPRRSIRDGRYKLINNLLVDRDCPILGVDGCSAYQVSQQPPSSELPIKAVYDRLRRPPIEELYDLAEDPYEFRNLALEPAMQPVLQRLRGELTRWRRETGDPLLDPATLLRMTAEHDALRQGGDG